MRKILKFISPYAAVALTVSLVTLILTVLADGSSAIADSLNVTVLAALRMSLASVTNPLPFSLFEILIFSLPVITTIAVIITVRRIRRGRHPIAVLVSLAATVALLLSLYQLTIGIAYDATSVGDRLGITEVDVTEDNLASTLERLTDEINDLAAYIDYSTGRSDPGYTVDSVSAMIAESYEKFADLPGFSPAFSSRAKPMILSPLMTSLELTGIYFPYTGESNVNTLYPTYDLCYTIAHEMSHQRGIMRENEANFMAFLLCYTSDDPYLRYSAAMNIYSYVANALNATNRDRFLEIYSRLSDGPRADFAATRAVADEYENELLAEISERVNDWFLKSNGTPGVVSYGMVVRLAVAYLSE